MSSSDSTAGTPLSHRFPSPTTSTEEENDHLRARLQSLEYELARLKSLQHENTHYRRLYGALPSPSPSPTPSSPTMTQSMALTTAPPPYIFPSQRLRTTLHDPTKTPLVLVACGSFSPITHMHLRMFEMAVDHVRQNMSDEYEVIGGYISPVSDRYNKAGLASAAHRVRMCELATEQTSEWLMVDPWEAMQPEYQPTAVVLDHVYSEVQALLPNGEGAKKLQVSLLCGADLLMSMLPGVWSIHDLDHILGTYGLFVIERSGTSVGEALAQLKEINPEWVENIHIIRQLIANDISSTSIRQFLRLGWSVNYLQPWCVIEYIREHGLYEYRHEGKGKNTRVVMETGPSRSSNSAGPARLAVEAGPSRDAKMGEQ